MLASPLAFAGGSFTQTDDMGSKRALHGAALLPDGTVLVVGGISDFGVFVPTAELYDPAANTFADTGAPNAARMRPTVVALADGRVLVAGGLADDGATYLQSAEIYDPTTGEFTATGDMTVRRYVASPALLEDGRVLLAGGFNRDDGPLLSAELYDPATGEFTATGSLALPRSEPKAVVRLLDGRVLIAGGSNEDGPIGTAEIYDPATGEFSSTAGDLVHPIEDHSLALLDDGRVLVVGGSDGGQTGLPIYYADAELFDPATGMFTSTGSLQFPREFTTASRLPDGRILVAGGLHTGGGPGFGVVAEVEIYDPASGDFTRIDDMPVPLDEPVPVVLDDRRVLLVGGFDFDNDLPTASAEFFVPDVNDTIFADGFETPSRARR
ncbi:MAG TPA: kelch repeat-containing protein [Rhodanobacteraceae bacterium]|nr:kelch repeat-containing protein [Rhodanobacteraceae bacterium]